MPFDGRAPPMAGYPPSAQARYRMPGPGGARPPFPYDQHGMHPGDRPHRPEHRPDERGEQRYACVTLVLPVIAVDNEENVLLRL